MIAYIFLMKFKNFGTHAEINYTPARGGIQL
jgi:hypothetical protein